MGSGYQGYSYAIFNAATGPDGYGIAAPGRKEKESDLVGTKVPSRYIKVSQGFMVRALKPNASLKFNNQMRKKGPNSTEFFGKYADQNSFRLEMTSPTGVKLQNGFVYFEAGRTGFGIEDSVVPDSSSSDGLFSAVGDEKLVIDGRSSFTADDKIHIGTRHFSAGNYKLRVLDPEGVFAQGQPIYLNDKQLNTVIDLTKTSYSFYSESGEFTGRFEIVYRQERTLATEGKNQPKKELIIYRDGAEVVIRLQGNTGGFLEVYDLNGRLALRKDILSAESRFSTVNFVKGVYIVKVKDADSRIVTKKFRVD
jgi:hypothetical protein